MEEHNSDDYAVESLGQARVLGYAPIEVGEVHSLYDQQWHQVFDAEDNLRIKMQSYIQYCAIVGQPCDWCDEGSAVGYLTIPGCDCSPGGCKQWVCQRCGSWGK